MNKRYNNLKEEYTFAEAKELIDSILKEYGDTCEIHFERRYADLITSYKVTSRKTRHLVCEIIRRTGVTDRSVGNLSAEWMVHNVAWYLGVFRESAKDAALDYDKDPRRSVRMATSVLQVLGV